MAASSAERSPAVSVEDGFLGPPSDVCSAILRSRSFPPAEWMASMRALCSDVSFGAGLWTTGRNFFFGPKMLDGSVPSVAGMSVHNKLGFSSCSRGSCWVWLFVLDPLREQGGSAWMGTHREPFTRVLPGV